MTPWTIDRAIREMPSVRIRIRGKVETGRLSGKSLPFPRVSVNRGKGERESYEFSWETIAHCLNAQVPLDA